MKSAIVVTLGLLAMTGCTPKPDTAAPASAPPTKVDVLAEMAKDAKASLLKAVERSRQETSVTFTMAGTSDGKPSKGHGVAALGGSLLAEVVTEESADGKSTMRMIGTDTFVELAEKDRATFKGKSWMRMDMGGDGKTGVDRANQVQDINPPAQLKSFVEGGTVTVVGQEDVGGAQTVRFTSTIPLSRYLEQTNEKDRAAVEKQMKEKNVTEFKTDLWVDADYLLRRTRTEHAGSENTVEYTEYGKPVTVNPPPADQVVDFDEFLANIGN
jgi:hypothetical protein